MAASHVTALEREFWPATTERAMLDAREIFGESLSAALTDQPTKSDRQRDFAEPIELTACLAQRSSVPWILLFDHLHAPLLTSRHPIDPAALLWQVRAAAQHLPKLHVTVTCAPGAEHLASSPEAAFYGDGTWLQIDPPTVDEWDRASIHAGTVLDPQWLRISQRHVPTTLAMLRVRDREELGREQDGREVFREVAEHQHEHANRCLLHASSLHRLGAHVLTSIASGDGPYAGTPEARSDDVAAAAKALRLAGLICRDPDDDRGWLLTDPMIGSLLADPSRIRPEHPESSLWTDDEVVEEGLQRLFDDIRTHLAGEGRWLVPHGFEVVLSGRAFTVTMPVIWEPERGAIFAQASENPTSSNLDELRALIERGLASGQYGPATSLVEWSPELPDGPRPGHVDWTVIARV